MNKEVVSFQLSQALEQLEGLKEKVDSEDYGDSGDLAFASEVTTALNYLCNGWHFRNMTWEQVSSLSENEYESYAFRIPAFDPRFKMED